MSRSVGNSPGAHNPLTGENFTIQEIWTMSQRSNQVWGVEGYEVPVIHQDSVKMARDKELYEQATGKKKPRKPGKLDMKVKRGGAFTVTEKHSLMIPAPWMYDIKQKWMTGYQNQRLGDITPRAQKKLKYKWLATKAENQNFEKEGAKKQGKLNMDLKKNTFIEQIIHYNSKKGYPLPSPCTYWLNAKQAKKFYPENPDKWLVKEKDDKKKTNLPKCERKFVQIKRHCELEPGPDKYTPAVIMTDNEKRVVKKHEFMTIKRFKDKTGDDNKRHKESKDRFDGKMTEITGKLREGTIPKNPKPQPNDFMTFDKLSILYKDVQLGKASKKKGNGFGSQDRFQASELDMWKRKMEAYNKNPIEGKLVDQKKDPHPGPAHYSLIASWPGKKLAMKKGKKGEDDGKLPNIFKIMSKGPAINCYYAD